MIKWHYKKSKGWCDIFEVGYNDYGPGWICSCYGPKSDERAQQIVVDHNKNIKENPND